MAKKKASGSDELSIPAAISEVARGVATTRAMRPHDSGPKGSKGSNATGAGTDQADEKPQRSRAELKADIASSRAELASLVDEIEHRLDVPARAEVIVADFTRDPVGAVRIHKKTTATAVVAVAAAVTGIALLVRAIVK